MGGYAVLVLSTALQAVPQLERDPEGLKIYSRLVERYRAGEMQAALQELGERPDRSLREVVGQAVEALRARRTLPFAVPAAVLLHTDRALLARSRGEREAEVFQLSLARELAGAAASVPELEPFCRRYYLVVGHTWQVGEDWALARTLIDEGLQRFPDDAPLLTRRAAIAETLVAFSQAEDGPVRRKRTNQRGSADVLRQASAARQHRREAASLLRRALAAAPDSEEARLHLGRVLLEVGDTQEGLTLLEGLGSSPDPGVAYLAFLLRGGSLARSGRLEEALEAYRAAVAREPRGQAAHLALAHALDESGQPGAGAAVAEGLAAVTRNPAFEDPWWTYHFKRQDLLRPLRDEVLR